MKEPEISVVIPCYNDGKYLPETLTRLKSQTFQDFEVIVVNDGSTDPETLAVLNNINDPRVKVLHKENGRMSSARNYGVKEARGRFIAALDSDDYFENSFFEKALRILNEKKETAVVTSYIQLFGEVNKVSKPRGGNELNFLFSNQCPACAMVRKEVWDSVGGYDETMVNGYEDWEFYIRVTQQGWNIHVIPEKLLFYRQTNKSTHKNATLPNRESIINYILRKHQTWYLQKLAFLISNEKLLYKDSRISYQVISQLITNRVKGKFY